MSGLYSLEAEAGILGGLLFNNDWFERVSDMVCESDFAAPAHQTIFALIRASVQSGRVADGITLAEAARTNDQIAQIRGEAYLFELLDAAAIAPELWDYCRLVADLAKRRTLVEAGKALAVSAEAQDAEAALEAHEGVLEQLRERQAGHAPIESCADGDVFAETPSDSLLLSGFQRLDDEIGGFERGALSIIAARPGVGKTAFSIVMAANIARNETVGFLSLDMQGRVIRQRLAVYLHWNMPGHHRSPMVADLKIPGRVSPEIQAQMTQLLKGDTARRILVNDRGGQTTRTVAAQVRAWHRHCRKVGLPPLGAVFIDHIAKVAPAQKSGGLYEKTSFAANELLDVAKQNPQTAIIALCQLNRDTEKSTRRPMISDLRDSGKVEEDASLVLLLHREDMRHSLNAKNMALSAEEREKAKSALLKCKGDFEVIIGKNRNGEQGAIVLSHYMAFNAVRDLRASVLEDAA